MRKTLRTRKDPSRRRAEIVDAAIAVAGEIGLDRLTGRDIAARVGVAPGLVHHYFPQLDDLVAEAFRTVIAADIRDLADGLDDLPPVAALAEFLRRSLTDRRDPVLALWMSAWVAAGRRPTLDQEVERQMEAGVDLLAAVVERGRRNGEFATDDSDRSAWRIFVTLDGIAVQRTIRRPSHRAGDLLHVASQMAERELGLQPGALEPDPE